MNSKVDKINSLCSLLLDLKNIELEIQRLIESLPVLAWYDDLLQSIADLSNQVAAFLAEFFASLFGKDDQKSSPTPVYNLYNSEMGIQLFYQIFFSLREVLINQLYFDTTDPTNKDLFSNPAGANPQRLGFIGTITQNFWSEDDRSIAGTLAAEKYLTPENVYRFIWSDPRISNYPGPSRIDLPQYRNPIVPPNDYYDASYYSLRNSPEPLLRRLENNPSLCLRVRLGKLITVAQTI